MAEPVSGNLSFSSSARSVVNAVLRNYSLAWEGLDSHQQQQLLSVEEEKKCEGENSTLCEQKGYRCYIESWLTADSAYPWLGKQAGDMLKPTDYCAFKFDGQHCWAAQMAGRRSVIPCSQIIPTHEFEQCRGVLPLVDENQLRAFRDCSQGGWVGDLTNYTACHNFLAKCQDHFESGQSNVSQEDQMDELLDENTKRIVVFVFAGLAITSLVLLAISLFIFAYFKTLYCSRNSIHMNLFGALMLQVVALLVILSPKISGDETVHTQAWLCKTFMFLLLYTGLASIMWTFVEGLYLSQRLTLAVFKKEAPFRLYVLIGWGIPLVLMITWTLVMELHAPAAGRFTDSNSTNLSNPAPEKDTCWQSFYKQPYHWILSGPSLAALTVNLIFLVLIIIVLVTKLRANNAMETVQLRKAIKATLILVPLLGISNLLFFANPSDHGAGEKAYIVANLVLKGSQGIFVALIYCFLNSEVQMAVQKKFYRAALRRNPETQSFRFGSLYNHERESIAAAERRKSSTRTASTSLVSSAEVLRSMFRSRRSSSRAAQRDLDRNEQLKERETIPLTQVPQVTVTSNRDTLTDSVVSTPLDVSLFPNSVESNHKQNGLSAPHRKEYLVQSYDSSLCTLSEELA